MQQRTEEQSQNIALKRDSTPEPSTTLYQIFLTRFHLEIQQYTDDRPNNDACGITSPT
jgi:hypothetical protein